MVRYSDVLQMLSKKHCILCGAYMYEGTDSEICEVCLEDMRDDDPEDPYE